MTQATGDTGGSGVPHYAAALSADVDPTPEQRTVAITVAAGEVAEDLASGKSVDAQQRWLRLIGTSEHSDYGQKLIDVVSGSPNGGKALLLDVFAGAEDLLRRRWSQVKAISSELVVAKNHLRHEDLVRVLSMEDVLDAN